MLQPDGKPLSESSAFRGPKPQELVRLRKAIEGGDLPTVRTMVWGTPRYLVSSGDTPTVLQVSDLLFKEMYIYIHEYRLPTDLENLDYGHET